MLVYRCENGPFSRCDSRAEARSRRPCDDEGKPAEIVEVCDFGIAARGTPRESAVVLRSLEKAPLRRYQSARELRIELRKAV